MAVHTNNVISSRRNRLFLLLAFGIFLILSSGCAGSGRVKLQALELAPLSEMPDYVQEAAPEVQEAYRFAVANPEALEHIPCYCGCNSLGHVNNTECYVKTFNPDGTVAEFESHAAY
jgi:hypothetical protein